MNNLHIRRFIFLDIDGVINTQKNEDEHRSRRESVSSYFITLPKEKLQLLHRIVSETSAEVVICSRWRLGWSKFGPSRAYINLQNQLIPYGIQLIGWTPCVKDGKNRGIEVKIWLDIFQKQYGYIPPYIIIDNEIASLKYRHIGHIIETDTYDGLTPKTASIAIGVLLNQLKE